MLRKTSGQLRFRTAWRELLHPLPIHARHAQWLKRDTVEINEALLREPYYTIKSYSQPAYVHTTRGTPLDALEANGSAGSTSRGHESISPQNSAYTHVQELRKSRRATSPERLAELREQLTFSGATGPSVEGNSGQPNYSDVYGSRLRPRYPHSWNTVPPHQPSRNPL